MDQRTEQENEIAEAHERIIEEESLFSEKAISEIAAWYELFGFAREIARVAARTCIVEGPQAANDFLVSIHDSRS